MSHVFISHAGSTIALTHRIADRLRTLGYEVWWDDELPVHQPFAPILQERLDTAKAILVIWSSDAVDSDYVRGEAEAGRSARKLVQISIDGTVPPLPFNQTQYADLNGWDGATDAPGWRKVVASIAELVALPAERPGAAAATTQSDGSNRSRAGRLVIGLAVVLVVGVVAALWREASHRAASSSNTAAPSSNTASTDSAANVGSPANAADVFGNRPAVAVLPFENRSDDPSDAIFADGLVEDLIGRLSAWRYFPVIARASSAQFRGDIDIKRVAAALDVRYVVQGSVRRAADRIRVSAQLIDAQTSATVWSQTYDRQLADVFDLQDDISSAIAAPLVGDLTRAESNRAKKRDPQSLDAWTLYQLGYERLEKLTPADVAAARPLLERAAAQEPQFAAASARLAEAYIWEHQYTQNDDDQLLGEAVKAARQANTSDPSDALGYEALSFALLLQRDTAGGLAAAQTSVELNPSSPLGWSMLGYAQWVAGDPHAAIESCDRAFRLSPNDPMANAVRETQAEAHWEIGDFDTGLQLGRTIVASNPDYFWGYVDIALNASSLDRLDDARDAVARMRRLLPNVSIAMIDQRSANTRPEFVTRRTDALRKAGLD